MTGHGYNGNIFVDRLQECSTTLVRYCISICLFLTQRFTYHFSVLSDVPTPIRTTFSMGREKKITKGKKCAQLYVYRNTRWFIIIIFIIIMHRGGVSLFLVRRW